MAQVRVEEGDVRVSIDHKEESLEHWSGYRGSRPVRIGSGASLIDTAITFDEALERTTGG